MDEGGGAGAGGVGVLTTEARRHGGAFRQTRAIASLAVGLTALVIIAVLGMTLRHARVEWRYEIADIFPCGRAGLEEDAAKLRELVEKELESPDPRGSRVAMRGTTLIAETTLENHLRLARLFAQWRAAIDPECLVEVHSSFRPPVPENFLHEIGVCMDLLPDF